MKRALWLLPLLLAPLSAQPTVVKPTVAQTLTLSAYADNWCAIFINGKPVAVDSIDFLPHNQISVRILPEYPMTIAVLAKDNADPATGLEYGNRIGDAGFILKLSDGTVSNATWRVKTFFTGPLGSNVAQPQVSRTPLPDGWYTREFDASGWDFATEYPASRVGPDGDYVASDFVGASFIWSNDLDLDNTVILRTTVPAPAGYVQRWNTKPDLDVTQFPAELLPSAAANASRGQLANLATRAQVGVDANGLIPGCVITGASARSVLIRAVGPGLSPFGVPSVLADPVLTIFRGSTVIASNDNWGEQSSPNAVAAATAQTGAFALTAGSKDSALVLTLEPGAYTFQVSGSNRTSGIALVEVYLIP